MMHDWLDPETPTPRTPFFWAAVCAVVVVQLGALALLCGYQVRKAEARGAEVQMAQTALADCLQYIPNSTVASCNARLANPAPLGGDSAVAAAPAQPGNTLTVGYSVR